MADMKRTRARRPAEITRYDSPIALAAPRIMYAGTVVIDPEFLETVRNCCELKDDTVSQLIPLAKHLDTLIREEWEMMDHPTLMAHGLSYGRRSDIKGIRPKLKHDVHTLRFDLLRLPAEVQEKARTDLVNDDLFLLEQSLTPKSKRVDVQPLPVYEYAGLSERLSTLLGSRGIKLRQRNNVFIELRDLKVSQEDGSFVAVHKLKDAMSGDQLQAIRQSVAFEHSRINTAYRELESAQASCNRLLAGGFPRTVDRNVSAALGKLAAIESSRELGDAGPYKELLGLIDYELYERPTMSILSMNRERTDNLTQTMRSAAVIADRIAVGLTTSEYLSEKIKPEKRQIILGKNSGAARRLWVLAGALKKVAAQLSDQKFHEGGKGRRLALDNLAVAVYAIYRVHAKPTGKFTGKHDGFVPMLTMILDRLEPEPGNKNLGDRNQRIQRATRRVRDGCDLLVDSILKRGNGDIKGITQACHKILSKPPP